MNGVDIGVELCDHVADTLLKFMSLFFNPLALHADFVAQGKEELGSFVDWQVVLLCEDAVYLEQVDQPLFAVFKLQTEFLL
jgi:hypothetical protein